MARVMVVDDDVELRGALEEAGHRVQEAPDGRVALELFQREPCDVVITDLKMPVKDGLDTIVEIRRLEPKIKIIAISGDCSLLPNTNLELAKELGADFTLAKPFLQPEAVAAVE